MLQQFLTAAPEPRVNINTAPPEVIAALLPELSNNTSMVKEIIQARTVQPFLMITDVGNLAGLGDVATPLMKLITTRSAYFTITGVGVFASARRRIISTFRRNANGTSMLASWQEDERPMAQRILAIEIAGDSVRGALAERNWNSLAMLEVVEERRRADEADLAPALARLLDDAGKPDLILSALPGELVVKRMLSLPFKDQRRLTQTVPFALEEHLPVGVDESVVAFTRVGQEDDKTLVMAAMVRKDDLRRHLELLARAGINPTTVTLSALALAALLARVRNGQGGAHLLVDLDQGSTSMVLLDDSRDAARDPHRRRRDSARPTARRRRAPRRFWAQCARPCSPTAPTTSSPNWC